MKSVWGRWILVLLGGVSATLLAERWRGHHTLSVWKQQMSAQGEVFEASRVWPRASARSISFSNQLAQAMGHLPVGLGRYSGQFLTLQLSEPGKGRRGSQEPQPLPLAEGGPTNSWADLDRLVREAHPALQKLCRLMRNPPSGIGYEIRERLEANDFPNLVNVRRGAQALHAATMNALHQGDLPGALDNLMGLAGFVKLHADDPSLVSFMIRVAVSRLFVDVCWDALQAEGWTELQLARLQQACEDTTLLEQMPRTLEAERASRLHSLNWFRSHSYAEWVARYQPFYQSFGVKAPESITPGLWREWGFHPLWSFAWAEQEELLYLEHAQAELAIMRAAARHGSWCRLNQELARERRNYVRPEAAWRFYGKLPLAEEFPAIIGGPAPAPYPYPDFSTAWGITLKNLTLRQMVTASIAIKRYELKHDRLPSWLTQLVPGFVAALPRDFMDGQPLRYRPYPDGWFILYSVGEDGRDDNGDSKPAPSNAAQRLAPWTGRDWVWPKLEPAPAHQRPLVGS